MFQKKEWKARQVEYPGRRILRNVDTDEETSVMVERDEGTVTQEGDCFSSNAMNDLEQRIGDSIDDVENEVSSLKNSVVMTTTDPGAGAAVDYPDGTVIHVYE